MESGSGVFIQRFVTKTISSLHCEAIWEILTIPEIKCDAHCAVEEFRYGWKGLFKEGTILFGTIDIAIDELCTYLADNYRRFLGAMPGADISTPEVDIEIRALLDSIFRDFRFAGGAHSLAGRSLEELVSRAAGRISLVVGELSMRVAPANPMLVILALPGTIVVIGAREGVEAAMISGLSKY